MRAAYTTVDSKKLSPGELVDLYAGLKAKYPLISLEDPVMEDDFDTMAEMTRKMGAKLQLVGDDIFVTNPERLKMAIERKAGNALLLKVNQIGTVTEAMDTAALAQLFRLRCHGKPPLRGIGGHFHRRYRRSPRLRSDQDRGASQGRADRQV